LADDTRCARELTAQSGDKVFLIGVSRAIGA
jgi:hypothetical protein